MYTVVHSLDDDLPCEEFLIVYSSQGKYLKVLVDYNGFWWNPFELVHRIPDNIPNQIYDVKRVDMLPLHMYWREDSDGSIRNVISIEYGNASNTFYQGEDLGQLIKTILTMRELVL